MIPRIIHRIWLGDEEPEWTQKFRETWDRPGWKVRDWSEEDLFPLHNQDLYNAAATFAPDHVGQLRSDILRMEILYRFGGVYVDCDLECLRPIEPLVSGADIFAAWEEQGRWISNCFMGSVPKHHLMWDLIDGLQSRVWNLRGKGYRPNRLSGPHYLTAAWKDRTDVRLLPQDLIYPYNWRDIHRYGVGSAWRHSYTCHHWHNMRREKGVDPCPA